MADEFRSRYRCFVVDEYQDVTPLQQRLLDAWLGERDDLTVVGDANQTIYTFAGASPRYLLEFPRRFPDATVVRLQRDYRSTPQIVSSANQLISAARNRPAGSRLQLVGQLPPGPDPDFAEHDDEPAEAAAVVARIRRLVAEGTPPAEIAVLFRINAQSEAYEQALTEASIPYQVRGGERFFDRPEIRRAMIALRSAAPDQRTGADGPETDLVRSPARCSPRAPGSPTSRRPGRPRGRRGRRCWRSSGSPRSWPRAEPAADLARLVTELETRADAAHPPMVQGVTLASLHAAKGLEWDVVFLVGLADGTLPIQHADNDEVAIEEERRLLYVGITRARRVLSMSWSLARAPGPRPAPPAQPVPARAVPDSHPASRIAGERSPGRPGRSCRVCGTPLFGSAATKLLRCSDCPSDVDLELLDRLKRWRAGRPRSRTCRPTSCSPTPR